MIHHIKRATLHLIIGSLLFSALSLTALRLLIFSVESYKKQLSEQLSTYVEAPVRIGWLSANMRGLNPQLVLNNVEVSADHAGKQAQISKPLMSLSEIRIGINLLALITKGDFWSASWVTLVGVKFEIIRETDGSIQVVGLKVGGNSRPTWLLQGAHYELLQSQMSWQDKLKNGRTLFFDNVDMVILNQGERHRFNMRSQLTKDYGDSFRLSLDVTGDFFEPLAVNGALYLEGQGINLPNWQMTSLPLGLNITKGLTHIKLWGQVQQSRLVAVTGNVEVADLTITRQNKKPWLCQKINSQFHWETDHSQWQLTVDPLWLEENNKKWSPLVFSLRGTNNTDQTLADMGLYIQQANLQQAIELTDFFAPSTDNAARLFVDSKASGLLQELRFFIDVNNRHAAVNARFAKLSVAPVQNFPGLDNFTGQIKGSDEQGWLRFATDQAHVTYPTMFRKPLPVDSLTGTVNWSQTADDWRLSSADIALQCPLLASKSQFNILLPKANADVFMDISSAFAASDVRLVPHYLPVNLMSKTLVDWLDHAFIAGSIPKGGFIFRGKPKDYPFTKGRGVFEVLFSAKQMQLAYHPDWPYLKNLEGEVLFLPDSLQVNLSRGQTEKIDIKQAEIIIPSLVKSEKILVQGEFNAAINDTLAFIRKTPLDLPVAAVLNSITPEGNTQVKLTLQIPLEDYIPVKVDGAAKLSNAKLTVNAVNLPIKQINGLLKFNEKGIYSDELSADLFQNPAVFTLKTTDQQTMISGRGKTDLTTLTKQFKLPEQNIVQGSTEFQFALQLPTTELPSTLGVTSNLQGISIRLPDTLAKQAGETKSLALDFTLSDDALLPINLNYDNQLKAVINLDVPKMSLQSADFLIGQGVLKPNKQGIRLTINRNELALDNWLSYGAALFNDTSKTDFSIETISLHAQKANWQNTALGVFDLQLKQDGQFWLGDINSVFAKGRLKIPVNMNGNEGVYVDLTRLNLAVFKQLGAGKNGQAIDVNNYLRQLNVTSTQTYWDKLDLGKLRLNTEKMSDGIAVKNLSLQGGQHLLSLKGSSKGQGAQQQTQLQGRLDMTDAGQVLSQFDINKDLQDTSAEFDIEARWSGGIMQFALKKVIGKMNVSFKEGRILSIEPGFGRILGVLAMEQWLKRLQLDFSDIYQEGMAFNSINGHFHLADGKARTEDLVIDAIPANINIQGYTDLVNQTVDFQINVAPKSADAVPIAGTMLGKVTSLIGKTLTGKNQEGFFFGSEYQVKGAWGNTLVSPLHDKDGLLHKTWTGLTDFSWLKQQPKTTEKHP